MRKINHKKPPAKIEYSSKEQIIDKQYKDGWNDCFDYIKKYLPPRTEIFDIIFANSKATWDDAEKLANFLNRRIKLE
jgi:hypothetical protein